MLEELVNEFGLQNSGNKLTTPLTLQQVKDEDLEMQE